MHATCLFAEEKSHAQEGRVRCLLETSTVVRRSRRPSRARMTTSRTLLRAEDGFGDVHTASRAIRTLNWFELRAHDTSSN